MDNLSINSKSSAAHSVMSSYRTSFGGARGGSVRGMQDEHMDASINFGDEVSFGDGAAAMGDSSKRASTHKRMVDVFLAEEDTDGEGGITSIVGMQQTQKGMRAKKCGMYFCLALVLGIIFITAPKPGFLFGKGGSSSNDTSDSAMESEEATALPSAMGESDTVAPSEFLEEEVQVTKPPDASSSTTSSDAAPASDETTTDETETTAPVNTDIQVDMTRPDAIRAYVLETHVAHQAELDHPTSPASLSLKWLALEDSANLDVPGYPHNNQQEGGEDNDADQRHEMGLQLLQRFALGAFYFSLQAEFLDSIRRRHLRTQNDHQRLRDAIARHNNDQRRRRRRRLHDEDNVSELEENRNIQFENDWTVHTHVCAWFGVECDDQQHVVAVNVTNALLKGRLASEVFQEQALPYLTSLDVSHNGLFGAFPHHPIANTKLETLHMEHNKLTQDIDAVLQRLTALVNLDANSNNFTGTLPEDWTTVPNLGESCAFVHCCVYIL